MSNEQFKVGDHIKFTDKSGKEGFGYITWVGIPGQYRFNSQNGHIPPDVVKVEKVPQK